MTREEAQAWLDRVAERFGNDNTRTRNSPHTKKSIKPSKKVSTKAA
jgi:hypothetical protein